MRLILLIFGIVLSSTICSQVGYKLTIKGDDIHEFSNKKKLIFKDSLSAISFLRKIQTKAISQGHILASMDSTVFVQDQLAVHFYKGTKFSKIALDIDDDDLQFIKKGGIREKQIAKIPFDPKSLAKVMNELLNNSLNSGYPFAKVKLQNVVFGENDKVFAQLVLNKGNFFTWKDIHIKGDSALSKNTIAALIGIHLGSKFREDDLRYISENIRQVNYLKIIKPYELLFTEDGVELFLYIQSVPTSSANGILGLQPNSATQKMSVTGELNLKLTNLLHRGETMQVAWKSIRAGTQSLQFTVNYPFLFKSPFGLDGNFNLYKRDTTFLETKTNAGVQYFLGRGSYMKAFYNLYTSDLIASNASSTLQSLRTSSYGISILKRQIDYLPNPSRGYIVALETQIGQRKLTSPDSSAVSKKITSSIKFNTDCFINLGKRNVLRIAGSFATYYAPTIFSNELLRLGGLNSLRGFNEEELNATTFAVATVEYRFLTDRNSHAFVFFNQSIYENRAVNYYNDKPFGFGFGYAFGTPIGIFSISTALGKQLNNPLLLRNSKIHFGYIAYF